MTIVGCSRNRDHPATQREVAGSDANPALAQIDGDPQSARFETVIKFDPPP
jgi:hypothetical protein